MPWKPTFSHQTFSLSRFHLEKLVLSTVHVQLMCLIWITRWLRQPADFVARVTCPYFDQAATELQAICPGLMLEMCICVSKLRATSHCLPRSQALRTTPNILRSCGMVKVMRCLQRGQKWTFWAWYMGCMVSENTYTWLHIQSCICYEWTY